MYKQRVTFFVFIFFLCGVLGGCGYKKLVDAQVVIESSKMQNSLYDQIRYLMSYALDFMDTKRYDQAQKVANYILSLDPNFQAAKDILTQIDNQKQVANGPLKK